MTDHSQMKLGKSAAKYDSRTLRLARYLTPELPQPPFSIDNSGGRTDWGVMLNNNFGCCTIAGCGHALQSWTGCTVPDAVIISYYEEWDGFDPDDLNTDRGGNELDVLNKWRRFGFAGHQISGFAAVNPRNSTHVEQAIQMFGGIYTGIELPKTAQCQSIWDVAPTKGRDAYPGSWGGHCVWVLGYDQNYLTCVTWGKLLKMTWGFWNTYCSEAWAILSAEWTPPTGFDMPSLQYDLQLVSQ